MNRFTKLIGFLMCFSAIPMLIIGLSGVIYELFGPKGYERFLRLFHIRLSLGQIQLIGMISSVVTLLLFLIWRELCKK